MGIVRGAHTTADEEAFRRAAAAIDSRRPDVAEAIASDLLKQQPQNRRALHLLGVALVAQERAHEAVPPLQQALEGRFDAVMAIHLGKALRQVGRTAEALTWLERATAQVPSLTAAWHELGLLLCGLRRFDDAAQAFDRGLAVEPGHVEMMIELGGVHVTRADPAKAKVMFARALAQAPGHPRALHGFGTALMYEGDHVRAAERFRQALARNPDHARAQLDLGHCLIELGQWDEAVACLRGLNRRAPQLYGRTLRTVISSGRGRFWLRPTAAARFMNPPPVALEQAAS
jgi:cytochrome c-type biogenesis protein CcmH/NrfG